MLSLGSWFRRYQTPLLGVDVNPAGIRILELIREGKGFRVVHFAQEALPAGALRDGGFAQMDTLTDALRRVLRASGTRLRTAAMALPSGAVIKKMLTLPAGMYDEELEMQVETEASQTLPFSLDEISLDFAIAGPSSVEEGHVDVMLVAARKERIDERLALADAAGLRPLVIDVESQAITTALTTVVAHDHARYDTEPVVLLQLGSEGSHCFVMLSGLVVFERELGVSLPRADQDKSRIASDTLREAVCQELARALQLFGSSTQYPPVAHVYIAGSVRAIGAELLTSLQRRTGVSVSLADPFARMRVPSTDNRTDEDAPAWLMACGLALRSFAQ